MIDAGGLSYSIRLFTYHHFWKRSRGYRFTIFATLFLFITYVITNELYAWKLILEQECFSKPPPPLLLQPGSNNCLARTWERYTHVLSERDAKLLHVDIPTAKNNKCKRVIRLGHKVQDGGWDVCADDFDPKAMTTSSSSSFRPAAGNATSTTTTTGGDPRTAGPCIVYSFGINDDPSFDLDLVKRYPSCTVYAFDPSIGRETGDDWLGDPKNIQFYNIGLGHADKTGSGEEDGKGNGKHRRGWKIMTLDSIMTMLRHDHVNLVKMDIEGDEWETFASWERTGVHERIGQLVGEVHFLTPGDSPANVEENVRRVGILKLLRDTFRFDVFRRSDNFRWSRLVNVPYSSEEGGKKKSWVRSYRCLEIGWRKRRSGG